MDRRTKSANTQKRRRRIALALSLVAIAAIIVMIALEQVAVLYVLATLSLAALLAIVSWADLGGARKVSSDVAPHDDAAAIADGLTVASTTFSSTAPRGGSAHAKRR